jgi:hypothetical protein
MRQAVEFQRLTGVLHVFAHKAARIVLLLEIAIGDGLQQQNSFRELIDRCPPLPAQSISFDTAAHFDLIDQSNIKRESANRRIRQCLHEKGGWSNLRLLLQNGKLTEHTRIRADRGNAA